MNKTRLIILVALIIVVAITIPYIRGLSGQMKIDTKEVVVPAGETFEIVLDENASTGYSWQYSVLNPEVAIIVKDEPILPDSRLLGASGNHRFIVKGLKQGKCEITFKYLRSWDPNSIEKSIRYIVEVK